MPVTSLQFAPILLPRAPRGKGAAGRSATVTLSALGSVVCVRFHSFQFSFTSAPVYANDGRLLENIIS